MRECNSHVYKTPKPVLLDKKRVSIFPSPFCSELLHFFSLPLGGAYYLQHIDELDLISDIFEIFTLLVCHVLWNL
jgi:hypothetical protein